MTLPIPNTSTDLTGQVALVTGGSAGMGVRFAQVLAACGAKVAICARRADKLEEVAAGIRAAGGEAIAIPTDVTDADQLIAAVEKAEAAFGTVTILINNAGIPDGMRAHKMPLEFVDQILGVNLRAPWILACEVARRLIAAKKPGRIINLSSTAHYGYQGGGAALYSVTKTAIARMTEVLSTEWAFANINVNAIAPGMVDSEMLEGMFSRTGDLTPLTARKRTIDPAQMDSTLLYLVSPASECVTGAVIKLDDGQSARA